MARRVVLGLLYVLAVGLLLGATGYAQTETARLQGTITDPSGGVVVGATVTVTNTETGRVATSQTNDRGYYVVPALPAGHYHIDVTQKGFDKETRDFELQVAQIDHRLREDALDAGLDRLDGRIGVKRDVLRGHPVVRGHHE